MTIMEPNIEAGSIAHSLTFKGELDNRVESKDDIILASKIVVKVGTFPTRMVLRKVGKEYITHMECLKTDIPREGQSCRFVHSHFMHGHYFNWGFIGTATTEQEAAKKAYEDYKERVKDL